jgi:hypothetical protein
MAGACWHTSHCALIPRGSSEPTPRARFSDGFHCAECWQVIRVREATMLDYNTLVGYFAAFLIV